MSRAGEASARGDDDRVQGTNHDLSEGASAEHLVDLILLLLVERSRLGENLLRNGAQHRRSFSTEEREKEPGLSVVVILVGVDSDPRPGRGDVTLSD